MSNPCLSVVLAYSCTLFVFFLILCCCSSKHSGVLNWRRSFLGVFSIFYSLYLQDLQNWYCALVSGLLPSFPGEKRYVYVIVLSVVLSSHLYLQNSELFSWIMIGLPWGFLKDNIVFRMFRISSDDKSIYRKKNQQLSRNPELSFLFWRPTLVVWILLWQQFFRSLLITVVTGNSNTIEVLCVFYFL